MSKAEKDLEGRTVLVTGGNTGIGRATALALGRRGAKVWLAARSAEKTQPVVDELRAAGAEAAFFALDLGDLTSVRACAARVLAKDEPLHVLINNAGLAGQRGRTQDGFERTFGVNHLGHFLLTELLRPRLVESAPARVVIVSSRNHTRVSGIEWAALTQSTRSRTGLPEYGVSKLCNVLHASELARRLEGTGVTTYSLHPGVIASDVWRQVPWPVRPLMTAFMKSNEEGAETTVYCATSEQAGRETGLYYDECRVQEPSRLAKDPALAKELWDRSVAWVH